MIYEHYHPFISRQPIDNGLLNIEFQTAMIYPDDEDIRPFAKITSDKVIDSDFKRAADSSLALMRTCKIVYEEIRPVLRGARYIINLTDPRLYWCRISTMMHPDPRINCDDIGHVPKPQCLVFKLLSEFGDGSISSTQEPLDEEDEEELGIKLEILDQIVSELGRALSRHESFRSLRQVDMVFQGVLSKSALVELEEGIYDIEIDIRDLRLVDQRGLRSAHAVSTAQRCRRRTMIWGLLRREPKF